jgi:hypothetical protein
MAAGSRKWGSQSPLKKLKIEGIDTLLTDVPIPAYAECEDDDESFELNNETNVDDPQGFLQFLA